MRWVLLHSLLLLARTPTCNGVYQIRYGFVVISITRRGGIIANFCDGMKLVILALLPTVFPNSSTSVMSDILIRLCGSLVASQFEGK